MSVVDVWWFRNSIVIGVDQFSLVHERTRKVTKKGFQSNEIKFISKHQPSSLFSLHSDVFSKRRDEIYHRVHPHGDVPSVMFRVSELLKVLKS